MAEGMEIDEQPPPARRPVTSTTDSDPECPERELTQRIIGCAIEVHKTLGPGFKEGIYENAMIHELTRQGLAVNNQRVIQVFYKGTRVGWHRIDLVVEEKVIIELKHVETILKKHMAQTISTLKAAGLRVGLLINFNETRLMDGLRRVVV